MKNLGLSYRVGRSSDIRAGAVQKCYDTPLGVSIEKDREKSHKGKMFSFSLGPQGLWELPQAAGYLIEYKQIVRCVASILGLQNITMDAECGCTFVTTGRGHGFGTVSSFESARALRGGQVWKAWPVFSRYFGPQDAAFTGPAP
jgi:hypothetical protein